MPDVRIPFPALMLVALVSSACAGPTPPPLRQVADVKQLMVSVLEPAADEYWDGVGTIIDRWTNECSLLTTHFSLPSMCTSRQPKVHLHLFTFIYTHFYTHLHTIRNKNKKKTRKTKVFNIKLVN